MASRRRTHRLFIRVESEPGSEWKYSGGGYTVMLQTVMDVTKEPFPKLMHDTVLAPIGMTHSTYEQPLPEALRADAAVPYNGNGKAVVGGSKPHVSGDDGGRGYGRRRPIWQRYCSGDGEVALDGKANHVLTEQMTKEMVTAGKGDWGLGLQIGGSKADPYFTHGGSNAGFEGDFVAYEHHGDGAVVLTNAQGVADGWRMKLCGALPRNTAGQILQRWCTRRSRCRRRRWKNMWGSISSRGEPTR